MSILEGADVEISSYEIDNPLVVEFLTDKTDKIEVLGICEYLGINDNNFGDSQTLDKVEKIVQIIGKENALEKIQSIVSEVGFKPGIIDEIYAKVMLDREINRTSRNLDRLLQQKYGNSSSI